MIRPMASLRTNVAANFIGQAWIALIGVLFLPVYIRLLGMEAYGLIGVYISLQALLFMLDLGLSSTLNRELARYGRTSAEADSAHDLVRTLEWAFWPLCAVVVLLMVFASPLIAEHWLQPVSFPIQRVAHALVLMAVAIAAQWPAAFYAGGLNGLERQVEVNLTNMVFATLRWVAVIPVLRWIGPTIEVYLYWQIAIAILQTVVVRVLLARALPGRQRPARFSASRLRDVRGFALGTFFIAALSFVLIQADRLVLSRLLPLDQFGAYVLVATVAATLSRVFSPFFAALYPRYSGLVATGDDLRLAALYHGSNQLLAVIVAPVAAVLAFFSEDVLRLWTHNPGLASRGAPILSMLVVGTGLNGMMNLPYALQLAHGWTRLAIYQNLVAVCIVVPASWSLAHRFGALGAASMWTALNLGYVLIGIPLMHRRLLSQEMKAWYLKDMLPSVAVATLTTALMRQLLDPLPDSFGGVLTLATVGVIVLSLTAACSTHARLIIRSARESGIKKLL
jgi:O-antigen/teichoic acid export membrane protein